MSRFTDTAAQLFFRRVPDFRGKRRVARLAAPLFAGATIETPYGVRMHVDARDSTNFFGITAAYGDDVSREIVNEARTCAFLDIGANAGLYTLLAAAHFDEGVVLCFEPQRRLFITLLRNLSLNGARNVVPVNAAIGAETGWLSFHPDPHHTGSIHMATDARDGVDERVQRAVSLDADAIRELVERMTRGRELIVKIDVEGAEALVVDQLFRAVEGRRVRKVIVEIDDANARRSGSDAATIYTRLGEHGLVPTRYATANTALHYDEIFVRR